MSDLTTLQLARKIADAVWISLHPKGAAPNRSPKDHEDPPTQAVLRTLRKHDSWFCRYTETPQGTIDESYPHVEDKERA